MAAITTSKQPTMRDFIGKMDPEIDKQARQRIVTCRVNMFLSSATAFFGNLITRMNVINADEWCGTMATDGRNLYYNSKFVMFIQASECKFILAHEIMHVIYDHMDRRGIRNPQLWNVAADYAANYDLVKCGLGVMPTTVPGLYDVRFADMPVEKIYDILMEENKDDQQAIDNLIKKLLDDHMDESGDTKEGEGDGESTGNGRPAKMSDAEREELKREFRQAVLAAAQATGAGNLPGGVAKMIKDMTEPKMSWKEMLATTLTSAFRSDFTYMRQSRKGHHLDAYLPGRAPGERVDIGVAIDLSGSIGTDSASIFISEVKNIMESFDSYNIHIICFDTAVHNPQDFTSDNMEDILQYELKGGGGTDFDVVFDYLEENDKIPSRLVFFTDMYPGGSWGRELCDVLWISHGNPNPNPPFGTTVVYENM